MIQYGVNGPGTISESATSSLHDRENIVPCCLSLLPANKRLRRQVTVAAAVGVVQFPHEASKPFYFQLVLNLQPAHIHSAT